MKKFIIISIFIVIAIGLFFLYQQTSLKRIESSYSSMSVEIMSIPKDTIIENKTISDGILSAMKLSEWEKFQDYDYDFVPSRIIINIDDEYVFWIDEWDDNNNLCRLGRRYGDIDSITGVYKIPVGTVEQIEFILNSNDLDWNNLN